MTELSTIPEFPTLTSDNTLRHRIDNDSDFIALKRYNYSMKELIQKYPEGVPERVIAAALAMTEDSVSEMYEKVVIKLRHMLDVEVE